MHSRKIADVNISKALELYHSLPEDAFQSAKSNNLDKRYYKLQDSSIFQSFLNSVFSLIYDKYPYKGISQANLMRVHPEFIIAEHSDSDQYNNAETAHQNFPERFTTNYDRLKEGYGIQRFHLPIISDIDNVYFLMEGEKVIMRPGEIWWMDHYREHAVINNGTIDRVHFVIDTYNTDIDRSTDWD